MKRNYDIKPQKTKYGDIIFASRLEARWAVFFDCLGIQYEYEPFYSEVETGCRVMYYKPDFYLKKLNKFIEVKPSKPYEKENVKAAAWAKHINEIIILFNLNPPTLELENGWLFFFPEISKIPELREGFWWGECPKCGCIDIDEYAQITSCGCYDLDYYNKLYFNNEIGHCREKTPRLLQAYTTAKNFKFDNMSKNNAEKLPSQGFLFP